MQNVIMRNYEITVWEKAEQWYFYATVQAADETEARKIALKDYPKSQYHIRDIR